jgi:hypothetical protein
MTAPSAHATKPINADSDRLSPKEPQPGVRELISERHEEAPDVPRTQRQLRPESQITKCSSLPEPQTS